MEVIIKLPAEVKAKLDGFELFIDGPKGTNSKVMKSAFAKVNVNDGEIIIESLKKNRRGKTMMNTFEAHVNNLIKGVIKGYEAKLAIRYGHFPVTVKVQGNQLIIENFGGEKVPRKANIMPETKVEVKGSEIVVTGINKELVGQTAANIETASKVRNKDLRIFQDGIWIIKKPGREAL